MSREPTVPPPPRASETYGNVHVARVAHVDGRRNRPKKVQEQFNTKVAPDFPDRVDDVRRALAVELARDVTRGELLELMLAAYLGERQGKPLGEALATLRTPTPAPEDRAAGRTHPLQLFATPEVRDALAEMARTRGWTLGAVVEDTMAKAARLVALESKAGKKG
jgi:hypothetical protein